MHEESVEFFSEGTRVRGILRTADDAGPGPRPAIVQGPGWLGLKDSKLYVRYHEALTAAGFAVLIFDYRGFGDSDGDRGLLLPSLQLEDLVNAVTYLTTRDDVDPRRIGVFGSGGTGGGNAVLLGAVDDRVRCVVSQVPVADGRDWLRRMRREHEWFEFLDRLEADRRNRVLTGEGELVRAARRDHDRHAGAATDQGQGRRRRPHPESRSAARRRGDPASTSPSSWPTGSRRGR